ncbi:MAG: hypothetical protein JXR32_03375 [Anaerolineaceae bacterium]|nr:hypothetical protein [Anaerolineaceae bacterium]
MGDHLLGYVGDNIYFVWLIDWFKRALFELHVSPFFAPFLNYPEGWSLAYTEIAPIMVVMAIPFALVGGAAFGYNAVLMLTFILAGMGMYLWIKRVTNSKAAGLVAGTIYAFVPYHMAHALIGHFHIMGVQWFPFYFMGLYEILKGRENNWKDAALAGVFLGLIALTSIYYTYMALLTTTFLIMVYLAFFDRRQIVNRKFWSNMAIFIVSGLPLLLLGVLPFINLSSQGLMREFAMEYSKQYSASVTDFFLPSTDHFLWGGWIGSHFDRSQWIEATLYMGVVSSFLALLAFVVRKQLNDHKVLWLSIIGGLFTFMLALGLNLYWLNQPVTITLPEFLQSFLERETIPARLPGYYLYLYLPFYAKMRVWMRFGIYVLLFLSSIAGLGAAWLIRNVARKWRLALTILLTTLVIFEFYPGPYEAFFSVTGRPVDYWLAKQPGAGAVAQFPFELESVQEYIYFQGVHQKPYLGGFFNAFPPPQFLAIKPIMDTFPERGSIELLKDLGVEYVLIEGGYYEDIGKILSIAETNGLKVIQQFNDDYILVFDE